MPIFQLEKLLITTPVFYKSITPLKRGCNGVNLYWEFQDSKQAMEKMSSGQEGSYGLSCHIRRVAPFSDCVS